METASVMIDEASDLASDGKPSDAIVKYREALQELDRIEAENPDRAKRPEFATLRNKRAYVNAAIDALLMAQVRDNARAVAVTDTTELERRLAEEKAAKKAKASAKDEVPEPPRVADKPARVPQAELLPAKAEAPAPAKKASSVRERAMAALARRDYATAAVCIEEMLVAKPDDVAALNLRAAMETARGNFSAAEAALDQAIMAHPRNHFTYYNMARLVLQSNPAAKTSAKRYYETGRALGGPVDPVLEADLK